MSLFALAAAAALLPSAPTTAGSALRLPHPVEVGRIPGVTYDEKGERVGAANLVIERLDSGNVRMVAQSGFENGPRTVASAELTLVDDGAHLQLLTEESRSFNHDGSPRGVLFIDHDRGVASCRAPETKGGEVKTLSLPDEDRIANVPMNLLFRPLVRGEAERVSFQLFTCNGGPRIWDFEAKVAQRGNGNSSRHIVEVSYGPALGALLSAFARFTLPKLAFWFDAEDDGYLGHRLPLFTKGPNVVVIREGVSPRELNGTH